MPVAFPAAFCRLDTSDRLVDVVIQPSVRSPLPCCFFVLLTTSFVILTFDVTAEFPVFAVLALILSRRHGQPGTAVVAVPLEPLRRSTGKVAEEHFGH